MTLSLSSFALARRLGTVISGAPNLSPRRQRLFESSVRIRRTSSAEGLARAILYSSSALSKVMVLTPDLAAFLMKETALQGLANMILWGQTSARRTCEISPWDAQSEPVPSADSKRSI